MAAYLTEDVGPRAGAKSTGYLLLDFDHPNITLGQIIIEWDRKIVGKGQCLVLMSEQTVEQIALWRLLEPTALVF